MNKNNTMNRYQEDEMQQWATADYVRRVSTSRLKVRDAGATTASYAAKKPIVLLVEDNVLIQKINRFYLLSLGCEVLLASSGSEAMKMADETFDLVVLDIGLPDVSGIEVAKHFRCSSNHANTPIIALTALSRDIIAPCYDVGMNEVVQKPLPIDEMYTILHEYLPKFHGLLEEYWEQNQQKN